MLGALGRLCPKMNATPLTSPKIRAKSARSFVALESTNSSPDTRTLFSKARPLASRLGVSAKTIFRWADAGLISRRKINARVVLFDVREVLAFVEGCRGS